MLDILLYVSLICGGIVILSMLISLFAGLDLDMDLDVDDAGGVGLFKGGLTFISFGSYVVRAVLISSDNPALAVATGIIVGGVAVFLLSAFFKWLLRNQEEVNYQLSDALYKKGTVYLKIGSNSTGIVRVNIGGVDREMKAATNAGKDIPTGAEIMVEKVEDNIVYVTTDLT